MKRAIIFVLVLTLAFIFGGCSPKKPKTVSEIDSMQTETITSKRESEESRVWNLPIDKRNSFLIEKMKKEKKFKEILIDGVTVITDGKSIYQKSSIGFERICSANSLYDEAISIDTTDKGSYDVIIVGTDICIYQNNEIIKRVNLGFFKGYIIATTEKRSLVLSNDIKKRLFYIDFEKKTKKLLYDGVVDANWAQSFWFLTDKGEVYQIKDWRNSDVELLLRQKGGAIALSDSPEDAPGWFISGERGKEFFWVRPEIRAKFVLAW